MLRAGKIFKIPATHPGVEENIATFKEATISFVEPKDDARASIINLRTKIPASVRMYVMIARVSDAPKPNL